MLTAPAASGGKGSSAPGETLSTTSSAAKSNEPNEEMLKKQLREALQKLTRREPLAPTYKHFLTKGVVTPRKPTLPRDKLYKNVGARLRERVETFMQSTQGGDPWDRVSSREKIEEEALRAALTLREYKQHEQEALLAATLASLPRRNGMDEATRKRKMEGMALGLQAREKNKAKKKAAKRQAATASSSSMLSSGLSQEGTTSRNQDIEGQRAVQRAREREAARKRREEEERARVEAEREEELRLSRMVETPRQALHRLYEPIFRVLWGMEFDNLQGTNPFRIPIDRENCAAMGAPDYFDVVETPMNLTLIQKKVDGMEYQTLQAFFADIELMLKNALLYNSDPTNDFHLAAQEMKRKYKKLAKRVIQSVQQKSA